MNVGKSKRKFCPLQNRVQNPQQLKGEEKGKAISSAFPLKGNSESL